MLVAHEQAEFYNPETSRRKCCSANSDNPSEVRLADRSTASVALFGPFRLIPSQRLLLDGERPVRLGSRAFEMLIVLTERAGELVSKDELMARVWPDTTVGDANLKVHVAALRRALAEGQGGNRYIVTIPGRGYRFVAPLTLTETVGPGPPSPAKRLHNLPAMLTRLIGRANTVGKLVEQLPEQRFLTIVGTGGVGTTSVALALAENSSALTRMGSGSSNWRRLLILGWCRRQSQPRLEPSYAPTICSPSWSLRCGTSRCYWCWTIASVSSSSAAALTMAILKDAPGVHILATSREPLRVEGEHLHRLRPLPAPPSVNGITAAEALTFPAIQLFVERVAASLDEFELNDADAPYAADICTKLDGIPLAIEFAAARVDAFGVRGVGSRLDDRLRLLTSGRRTAVPRHQTMKAALDWSYESLPDLERVFLQRLGIFAGAFSMQAASAVVADEKIAEAEVADRIANLVAKSLVTADVGGAVALYRLLETTRAYAIEKLTDSGELQRVALRHTEYFRNLFERAVAEWGPRPHIETLADYRRGIDEVRVALDRAFSPGGDESAGVTLTIAAVPLWFELSLLAEACERIERALASIESQSNHNARRKMQLVAALSESIMHTKGNVPELEATWSKVLELADSLGDNEYQLRALWGLWAYRISGGDYRAALALAERFRCIAAETAGAAEVPIGDRMVGMVLHYLGDQTQGRHHIERMLRCYTAPNPRSHRVRFPVDPRIAAQIVLARMFWLQGFPDQAVRIAQSTVNDARALDHSLTLCYALAAAACPVSLLVGDLAAAENSVAMLLDSSAKKGLALWHAWGRSYDASIVIRRGDVVAGTQLLQRALNEVCETRSTLFYTPFLAELAECLGHTGEVARGLTTIDEALDRSERNDERWCIAELLRIKGDLVLLGRSRTAVPTAEALYADSLAWARQQEVLSWELRISISLARLRRSQGRAQEARDLLASVYGRFTEGFETADLLTAKQLLDQLA